MRGLVLPLCYNTTGCPRTAGEHKVHPYAYPETLCRGSVKILYSPGSHVRVNLPS